MSSMIGSIVSNTISSTISTVIPAFVLYKGMQFVGTGTLADKVSSSVSEFFSKAGKSFDGAKFGQFATNVFTDVFQNIDEKAVSEEAGKTLSNGFRTFVDNTNLRDPMGGFGKELGQGGAKFFDGITPAIDSIGDVVSHLSSNIIWATVPKYLAAAALMAAVPLTIRYVYHRAKNNIGKPELATEYKTVTRLSRLIDRIKSRIFSSKTSTLRPIFNPEIDRRITEFSDSIRNAQQNNGFMENLLLYGPPGTGKTMIAKAIADQSDLSFIKMSCTDLLTHPKDKQLSELNKLILAAKSRPTVLFLDEVDAFAGPRETAPNRQLLNAFLSHTGDPQKNLILITATNFPKLDRAFMSRMDNKFEIGAPAYAERKQILDQKMQLFFTKDQLKKDFSEKQLCWMTRETEGFTGRTLFKMVNAMKNRVTGSAENRLTSEILQRVVRDFVKQENKNLPLVKKVARKVYRSAIRFLPNRFVSAA